MFWSSGRCMFVVPAWVSRLSFLRWSFLGNSSSNRFVSKFAKSRWSFRRNPVPSLCVVWARRGEKPVSFAFAAVAPPSSLCEVDVMSWGRTRGREALVSISSLDVEKVFVDTLPAHNASIMHP